MGVKSGDVVKIDYILYEEDGAFIDSSELSNGEPIKIQLGAGQIIRGLENSIVGMEVGDEKVIILEPEDAFGTFEPLLVEKVPRTQFSDQIKVGDMVDFVGANGMSSPAWVRLIEDDFIIVDMNPPLAGRRVKFVIKLIEAGLEPDPLPNPFFMGMSCNSNCSHDHSDSN